MLTDDLTALTNRFTSQWNSTIPTTFDLAPRVDHPNGSAHFSVVLGTSQHLFGDASAGAKRQNGIVELNIDIPDEHGDADAIAAMEQFASIFRNWRDGNIVCRTEYVSPSVTLANGLVRFRISVQWYSIRSY